MVGLLHTRLAYVYSDDFVKYDFGSEHPLKPARLRLAYELSRAKGLFDGAAVVVPPRVASRDELRLFHTDEYLRFVKSMDRQGQGFLDAGDTPAFRGIYDASAMAVGASLNAVDAVMSGRADHAINISGGLHHAHRDAASGFCVFNDPAIAIAHLKKHYRFEKIMYLDIDAHHGDGVMFGFYSDPGVLDVDFHEDGRFLFPGSGSVPETGDSEGKGFKINVPLAPFTSDEAYLSGFRELVPRLVRAYKPGFVLVQCGADAHTGDALTHLQLTTRTYEEIITAMHDLAHEVASGRMVVFGGGGYNQVNVARCWAIASAALADMPVTDEVPAEWEQLVLAAGQEPPETLRSTPPEGLDPESGMIRMKINLRELTERIPLLTGA